MWILRPRSEGVPHGDDDFSPCVPHVPTDRLDGPGNPYLVEHVEQHLAPPTPDDADEFEFALDPILDGLERIRDAG